MCVLLSRTCAMVAPQSCIIFPVVQLYVAILQVTELAGQVTSQVPLAVLVIIGLRGSVLSIVILVQAITSLSVFTSAPASIPASLLSSAVV